MTTADIVTLTACPVCAGSSFGTLPVPGRWIGPEVFEPLRGRIGMMNCRDCGLDFVNPRPSSDRLGAFYNGTTYDCHDTSGSSSAGATADFLLDRIIPHLPASAPRSVLDYGAGGGGFLLHMRERGWKARGFEPGQRGRESCLAAGLDVTGDPDTLPTGEFGLVTLHHVFEHLESPDEALSIVRRVLAPEGRLFIEVPNQSSLRARLALPSLSSRMRVDERYRAFPIHLAYYNADTLERVLANSGWKVEHSFTAGMGLDEYLVESEAPARPAPSVEATPAIPATAAAAPAAATPAATASAPARPRLRHRVRDAYLAMGLGENLAVLARPA